MSCRYIHGGGAASASVSYRSAQKRSAPMVPITSLSPGWCRGSSLPRTECFGSIPIDQCAINFSNDTSAGELVKSWQIALRLQMPLAPGEYVDIGLPGFEKPSDSDTGTTNASATTTTIFAFEVMTKSVNPEFPVTLPDPAPEYVKIGCYEDVRHRRAVGGGTCGNFKDSSGVVTSVDGCARIAADKGFRGFCIADGSTCHTSYEFHLEYDTYNKSVDLGELEALAQAQFMREIQAEIAACLNASNSTRPPAPTKMSTPSNASNSSHASICAPTRQFEFNTSGLQGCLKNGMGGAGTMNCYQVVRKPKLATKIGSTIRCGQCGEWHAATQTLRFVAEEYVEAGLNLVLGFKSDVLPLRAPLHGLARDDKSISTMHSRDARDVSARDKERAICTVPPIRSLIPTQTSCVPPVVARTVMVRRFVCMFVLWILTWFRVHVLNMCA